LIKRVNEEDYTRIGDREEFKGLKQKPFRSMSYFNDHYADPNWSYFNQPPVMSMNQGTEGYEGRYNQQQGQQNVQVMQQKAQKDSHNYWKRKGIPEDKEGRMMAHYFDVEQYQDQMRNFKQNPPKKRKVSKKMIQFYKKKKEDVI